MKTIVRSPVLGLQRGRDQAARDLLAWLPPTDDQNGFKHKDPVPEELENYAFVYTNNALVRMSGTMPLRRFIKEQQLKYTAHLCRLPNTDMRKRILFAEGHKFSRTIWKRFETLLNTDEMQIRRTMMDRTKIRDLLDLL